MADLGVSVILQAVDKMTAPVRNITKATGNLTTGFTDVQKRLAELNKKATQVQGFADLKKKTVDTHKAFTEATDKVGKLAREINQAEKPTKKLKQQFEKAKRQAGLLKTEFQRDSRQLQLLRTDLNNAGISTRNFGVEQRNLKKQIEAATRVLQKQQALRVSFGNASASLGAVAEKTKNVGREAGRLGVKFAAIGGVAGWAFKRQFVDTAAQFEKYQTILETTEGSKDAAKKSMDWVSDFATKTPFELDQVTDAFVKLRAYGLDPTNGLLTTLGDTSSAMGKDVIQAVEAIADAVTGENERLKEFGVKASSSGGTITYEYTDKEGIQQALSVDKNDRKAIEVALTEIFNEKYAGSMDRLSKTWGGMVSNVADQWTRFKNMVMEAGVFDFMKTKLQGLLEKINQLAESGKLQEYAKSVADSLTKGMKALWSFGKAMVQVSAVVFNAVGAVAEAVGGWKVLLGGVAALMAGKFILSVVSLGSALFSLGKVLVTTVVAGFKALNLAMIANPIGLLIAAIAVAAVVIVKYWGHIKAFVGGVVEGFKSAAAPIMEAFKPIQPLFSAIGDAIGWVVNAISSLFQPVTATSEELTSAANAGYKFGEFLAAGINLALTPLKILLKGLEVGKRLWNWAFGDDDEQKSVTATKKIVQQVEQTGKIIPFPEQGKQGHSSASDYRPLKAASSNVSVRNQNTFHITQMPGEDSGELARRIAREEIKASEHQAKVQQRAALYGDSEYAIP